jgi:hypothetical protein
MGLWFCLSLKGFGSKLDIDHPPKKKGTGEEGGLFLRRAHLEKAFVGFGKRTAGFTPLSH